MGETERAVDRHGRPALILVAGARHLERFKTRQLVQYVSGQSRRPQASTAAPVPCNSHGRCAEERHLQRGHAAALLGRGPMEHSGLAIGKRKGLLVLLAFLLSLLPVANQATIGAAPGDRLVNQLADRFAFQASATALVPQTVEAPGSDSDAPNGGGDASSPPTGLTLKRPMVPSDDRALPPSTAPPGASSAAAYRARAPPRL